MLDEVVASAAGDLSSKRLIGCAIR